MKKTFRLAIAMFVCLSALTLTGCKDTSALKTAVEEAAKFCKMLVKKYDMEFYYSIEEQKNTEPEEEKKEEDFSFQLDKDLVADVMDAEDEHGNRRNS